MRSPTLFTHLWLPLATILLLGLSVLVVGCGGAPGPDRPANTDTPPDDGDRGDTEVPPPEPPQVPIWLPHAASYGRTATYGSFPSDLVRRGTTLFTTDADQVGPNGARVLAFDVSGSVPVQSADYASTTIQGSHLVNSQGLAADAASPIGFGFFLNDLLIVDDSLGFVLVNAGGSDTSPTLSNVVAFNPTTGAVLQTVNLANLYTGSGPLMDSSGALIPGSLFVQAGAEGLAYAPTTATTGRLFIAMSNLLFGAPSYGAVKYPGTVQVLALDRAQPQPLGFVDTPGQATETIVTQAYNPVAIEALPVDRGPGLLPLIRLLVTVAGTTGYDAQFNLVPLTSSTVEAYDAATGALEARFDLGLAGLSAIRPALGSDAAGHRVGFYPSSVTGEIYLIRLDGLTTLQVDASRLAVLRGPGDGIPITAAQSGGPGGNVTGAALSPDGRLLAITGFGDLFAVPAQPGRLFLLSLPSDVVTGAGFGTSFVPGSTEFASAAGRTLGKVLLVPNDGTRPDVFVNVSGTVDANYFGSSPASLGTLQTHGLVR